MRRSKIAARQPLAAARASARLESSQPDPAGEVPESHAQGVPGPRDPEVDATGGDVSGSDGNLSEDELDGAFGSPKEPHTSDSSDSSDAGDDASSDEGEHVVKRKAGKAAGNAAKNARLTMAEKTKVPTARQTTVQANDGQLLQVMKEMRDTMKQMSKGIRKLQGGPAKKSKSVTVTTASVREFARDVSYYPTEEELTDFVAQLSGFRNATAMRRDDSGYKRMDDMVTKARDKLAQDVRQRLSKEVRAFAGSVYKQAGRNERVPGRSCRVGILNDDFGNVLMGPQGYNQMADFETELYRRFDNAPVGCEEEPQLGEDPYQCLGFRIILLHLFGSKKDDTRYITHASTSQIAYAEMVVCQRLKTAYDKEFTGLPGTGKAHSDMVSLYRRLLAKVPERKSKYVIPWSKHEEA